MHFIILVCNIFFFQLADTSFEDLWQQQRPEVVTFLLRGRLIGRSPSPPMKGQTVSHPCLTRDSNPGPQVQQSARLSTTPVGRLLVCNIRMILFIIKSHNQITQQTSFSDRIFQQASFKYIYILILNQIVVTIFICHIFQFKEDSLCIGAAKNKKLIRLKIK